MIRNARFTSIGVAGLAFLLAGCGGGGGGGSGLASTPPPPAPPPVSPAGPPVKIFANPVAGEYASVGASIAGPGGNLDGYESAESRFGPIATEDSKQAQVRYTSDGFYEVKLPEADWDRLIHYDGLRNPDPSNNYFQPSRVQQNAAYLLTSNTRDKGYQYTELASWGSSAAGRYGYVAFGSATPASGVPTTGSATFNGIVAGSSDIMAFDSLYGAYYPLPVDGTVALNVDFGKGTLGGSMSLFLPDGMQPLAVGTFAFKDTIFSAGSTTYAGKFDTVVSGQNFFLGRFMGPSATETGAVWALPFVFSNGGETLTADNQRHQAFGAWIAKRN